jgi:predicted amidohydrolase YtcJ
MYAATTRRAPNGTLLGRDEILTPEQAIALFTTPLSDPGGAPRRIEAGQAADICLLTEKWATARRHLATVTVRATLRDGQVIHNNT